MCDIWFYDNVLAELFQEVKLCLLVCRVLVISECICIAQYRYQLGARTVALSDHNVSQILVFGVLADCEFLHVG